MSEDIVERLRWNDLPLDHEAADEIERLRTQLERGKAHAKERVALIEENKRLRADRDEARKAARKICDFAEVSFALPWLESEASDE